MLLALSCVRIGCTTVHHQRRRPEMQQGRLPDCLMLLGTRTGR